jgi:hypothetical protein
MDSDRQLLYRLGRRMGAFGSLDDMNNQQTVDRVKRIIIDQKIDESNIEIMISRLMERFI